MKVILNNIRGIDDAIVSLYESKGNYKESLEAELRQYTYDNTERNGFLKKDLQEKFSWPYKKMLKIGQKHTTIIRFIDFSFSVIGLHRGGQDDLDAHAQRFNNRIIRLSTRLCSTIDGDSLSEYYKDKIIPMDSYLKYMNIQVPDTIIVGNDEYVKTNGGYVNRSYIKKHPEEAQDVERGLYGLAIPSTCIVKCDLFQYAHVYKIRNKTTNAHPELRDMIESLTDQLADALNLTPEAMRAYLMGIEN